MDGASLHFYLVLLWSVKMVLYRFYILVGHCRKIGLRVLRDVSLNTHVNWQPKCLGFECVWFGALSYDMKGVIPNRSVRNKSMRQCVISTL